MFDEADSLVTLMRDTSLNAALLSGGAVLPPVHVWRARCIALAEALQQAMLDAGYPASGVEEASLAQCTLLDELTLRALPAAQRDEWLREPLQARLHGVNDGAARVWARIDALLRGERHNRAALEWYGIVLALGFTGGRSRPEVFARRAWAMLDGLTRHAALMERPPSFQPRPLPSMPLEAGEPLASSRLPAAPPFARRGMSALQWLAIGVIVPAVVAGALWIALDARLSAATDSLSSHLRLVDGAPQGGVQ